jgi:hypothetical protein
MEIANISPAASVSAKLSAEKKSNKEVQSKMKEIKYSDKSAGQPEVLDIFNAVKAIMLPFVKGTIVERGNQPGIYSLVSEKRIEAAGRKFDEIYFASIMVHKGYVGFYFMPVYTVEGIVKDLKPALLKLLKGKSCFHIKMYDVVVLEQIKEALELGYRCYEKNGWV